MCATLQEILFIHSVILIQFINVYVLLGVLRRLCILLYTRGSSTGAPRKIIFGILLTRSAVHISFFILQTLLNNNEKHALFQSFLYIQEGFYTIYLMMFVRSFGWGLRAKDLLQGGGGRGDKK